MISTRPENTSFGIGTVSGTGEDSGGLAGWTIGNRRLERNGSSASWSPIARSLRMVLTGREASADVGLQTIRVTRPGLDRTIEPGTGGGVYTTLFGERAIGPGTAIITVSTLVTGHNATIEYLDAADEPITDTNTMTEALEMSAARGLNTIKVKGTAEDTATTQIQTLRIVRAAAAPPKDATAEYTGNITVAEPSGFKGFNSIGRWSGAITHHRIETMRVDSVKRASGP